MKLRDITKQLEIIDQSRQPILFFDNDHPNFCLKYRHTKDIPIGFFEYYNYELEKYINEILDLDVAFSCDKITTFNIYLTGVQELFYKISRGDK